MQYAKSILDRIGVGGSRLEMFNLSSAEGKKWADICTEMTERIKALGPNPVRLGKKRQPLAESVEMRAEAKTV